MMTETLERLEVFPRKTKNNVNDGVNIGELVSQNCAINSSSYIIFIPQFLSEDLYNVQTDTL